MSVGQVPLSILSQLEANKNVHVEETATYVAAEEPHAEQSLTCSTCNLELEDKSHFKSDFHRFNLKRKLKGLSALNESQFDDLDDVSSIEGSDSDEDGEANMKREEGSPFASFFYSEGTVKKELLVYKQVLHSKTKEPVDYLKKLQEFQFKKNQDGPYWSMFLLSSGHFVGAIINLQTGKPVVHKSFHRYTTRRKQGGAQSSNDKSKGKAKSAGAGIRRYNEQALKEEMQELLSSWKDFIQMSSLIFVRAPVGMRSTILSENSSLNPNGKNFLIKDDRIRSFPFVTKRPTLSELMRCFEELTGFKCRDYVQKTDNDNSESLTETLKLDPVIDQFIDSIRRGKVDILSKLITTVEVNYTLPDSKGISFLHIAACNPEPTIVEWLLENGADPTKRGENSTARPYDVAVSKDCRDTFRKFMAKYPLKWDYSLSNIPSALTEEMEEAARKHEKEKRRKEREKKKAQKKLDAPVVTPDEDSFLGIAPTTKFKNLSLAGLRKSDKELLSMSPEQRMRMDREKRALAAESRLRSQKSECGNCGKSLIGFTSFDKSVYRYCSIECLKENQVLF